MTARPAPGIAARPKVALDPRIGDGPAASVDPRTILRWSLAALVVLGLGFASDALLAQPRGASLSLSLILGALFGFVLQRSRFCFLCHWRDFLDARDPRGILAILAALAVGVAGYTVVYGAWMPDPSGTRLPPGAHIGPVGPVLIAAGLSFGAGMAISGSCISAHLYRLGEGSPTAPFALVGAGAGFALGFVTWNPLYLASLSEAPILWLPRLVGYAGALLAALAVLGALALWLLTRFPTPGTSASKIAASQIPASKASPLAAIFVARWPAWTGGVAVGLLGTVAYLRLGPLGVTSELGARSRAAAAGLGLIPERLEGLDTFRGCVTLVRDTVLTPNGLFVAGLVLASFAAALAAGQFRPAWPTGGQIARGAVGGLLLGWGAMTGLGCSVGTLLSGISAGAVSGWVFAIAMFAGATAILTLPGIRRPS